LCLKGILMIDAWCRLIVFPISEFIMCQCFKIYQKNHVCSAYKIKYSYNDSLDVKNQKGQAVNLVLFIMYS